MHPSTGAFDSSASKKLEANDNHVSLSIATPLPGYRSMQVVIAAESRRVQTQAAVIPFRSGIPTMILRSMGSLLDSAFTF